MLFNKAFPTEKNVKLTIVPHSPFFSPDEEDAWNSLFTNNLGNRVRILPKLTKEALIDVMAQADCGIFPTRAEGWGMPILEMMAMGKNVIVNNYSGITEYCNTSNSILVDPIGMEPAIDNKWFNGFGSWSKIDENSFILAMRDCYEKWKKGQLKDNQEGIKTAQKFNWKNSAHKLLNSLAKG
jgi:glycosyltransferase involved in cell wall biosynthesis